MGCNGTSSIMICNSICNNLKRDHLEIQRLKFENKRLGLTESVHER